METGTAKRGGARFRAVIQIGAASSEFPYEMDVISRRRDPERRRSLDEAIVAVLLKRFHFSRLFDVDATLVEHETDEIDVICARRGEESRSAVARMRAEEIDDDFAAISVAIVESGENSAVTVEIAPKRLHLAPIRVSVQCLDAHVKCFCHYFAFGRRIDADFVHLPLFSVRMSARTPWDDVKPVTQDVQKMTNVNKTFVSKNLIFTLLRFCLQVQ